MGDHSAIEWTDATWNPVRGCTEVSPVCKFCYAELFAERSGVCESVVEASPGSWSKGARQCSKWRFAKPRPEPDLGYEALSILSPREVTTYEGS